jgi:SAM-dependent methyltransferase
METRTFSENWLARRRRRRAQRALERQLEYQEQKAADLGDAEELRHAMFLRSQAVRQKIGSLRPIADNDLILEVGSGSHGLIFGLGHEKAVGIDPLAHHYKRLFPKYQGSTPTLAAEGEALPFDDEAFDIVLSDNVIDHAREPVGILEEIVRVMKPGGILFFTVNIHHPVYEVVSKAHGLWNALGVKLELSPFADHTVHFSEKRIRSAFEQLSVRAVRQSSTVAETKKAQRSSAAHGAEALLKRVFFKNALFELLAVKD